MMWSNACGRPRAARHQQQPSVIVRVLCAGNLAMSYQDVTPAGLVSAVKTPNPVAVEFLPRSRILRGASVWLSFYLFQVISQVSGLASAQRALHGEWGYVIAMLASLGTTALILLIVRQIESFGEFVAMKSEGLGRAVRRCFIGILLTACVAAPIVYWWSVRVADECRDAIGDAQSNGPVHRCH